MSISSGCQYPLYRKADWKVISGDWQFFEDHSGEYLQTTDADALVVLGRSSMAINAEPPYYCALEWLAQGHKEARGLIKIGCDWDGSGGKTVSQTDIDYATNHGWLDFDGVCRDGSIIGYNGTRSKFEWSNGLYLNTPLYGYKTDISANTSINYFGTAMFDSAGPQMLDADPADYPYMAFGTTGDHEGTIRFLIERWAVGPVTESCDSEWYFMDNLPGYTSQLGYCQDGTQYVEYKVTVDSTDHPDIDPDLEIICKPWGPYAGGFGYYGIDSDGNNIRVTRDLTHVGLGVFDISLNTHEFFQISPSIHWGSGTPQSAATSSPNVWLDCGAQSNLSRHVVCQPGCLAYWTTDFLVEAVAADTPCGSSMAMLSAEPKPVQKSLPPEFVAKQKELRSKLQKKKDCGCNK